MFAVVRYVLIMPMIDAIVWEAAVELVHLLVVVEDVEDVDIWVVVVVIVAMVDEAVVEVAVVDVGIRNPTWHALKILVRLPHLRATKLRSIRIMVKEIEKIKLFGSKI
jgi:hypothetical protein